MYIPSSTAAKWEWFEVNVVGYLYSTSKEVIKVTLDSWRAQGVKTDVT